MLMTLDSLPATTWGLLGPPDASELANSAVLIRPGHPLGPAEAKLLVDQLFGCDDPFSDPAGRPTMTRWSTDEIDRRFRPR